MLLSNFQRSLAAVIVGNLIYFALFPVLPQVLHHGFSDMTAGRFRISMGKFDWGLLLDFLICTALYIVLGMLWSGKRRDDSPKTHA
jgi:branched-subunit amino acid transport protein AzlD